MNTENEKVVRDLPCPFCGGEVDPEGWLDGSGQRGPECEECGATANSIEVWNRRAALQSQSNTDGWVTVPVEPTSDQVNDGADAMRQAMAMFNRGRSVQTAARRVYEAMLSAAQKAKP